jgi:N-acetylneuraminic acid mutarotase
MAKILQIVVMLGMWVGSFCISIFSSQLQKAPDTNSFSGSVSVNDWFTFVETGGMNKSRTGHKATILNNGKVLIVGGSLASDECPEYADLYDPVTDVWTQTGKVFAMRRGHSATVLPNGKVLVVGGYGCNSSTSQSQSTETAELYDPGTGEWSTINGIKSTGHTATLLLNPDYSRSI